MMPMRLSRCILFLSSFLFLCTFASLLPACNPANFGGSPDDQGNGTLRVALVAASEGRSYRLRQAVFYIMGPTTVVLDPNSQPASLVATAQLPPGDYSVLLTGEWYLERLDADYAAHRVDATLATPTPLHCKVSSGTTTTATLRFETEGTIVDLDSGTLAIATEVTPPHHKLSLLAGKLGETGSGDGRGPIARFREPRGIALDKEGNLYVADGYNSTIRRIVAETGDVTTLAGSSREWGTSDGFGENAFFREPSGVALDGVGNVYVAERSAYRVRRIVIATGEVTTLAGAAEMFGTNDGVGPAARFGQMEDIVADDAGNLYVADTNSQVIRKIVIATGEVTTVAGRAQYPGIDDGVGAQARFDNPAALALDRAGNLYVSDRGAHTIRKIVLATAEVTTIAGTPYRADTNDGFGANARFYSPIGLASDSAGNLYVADSGNATIRKIVTATGQVSTLAGVPRWPGSIDGVGGTAQFSALRGLAFDGAGHLYVSDGDTIRAVTLATGEVSTLAGSVSNAWTTDGTNLVARFSSPQGIVRDGAGDLYVSDTMNNTIRKITMTRDIVTTVAGDPSAGWQDGAGTAARFSMPWGIAADRTGNLYVSDGNNDAIRKIETATGQVTTIAMWEQSWNSPLTGTSLPFHPGYGLTIDDAGNLFVCGAVTWQLDLATGAVRDVGGASSSEWCAVASDSAGHLYVADAGDQVIRMVDLATRQITTLAGLAGAFGYVDGVGSEARFAYPTAIVWDNADHLYVADRENHTIRKVSTDTGTVTTVIGTPRRAGVALGDLPAQLNRPSALALLPTGDLVIVDENSVLVARF